MSFDRVIEDGRDALAFVLGIDAYDRDVILLAEVEALIGPVFCEIRGPDLLQRVREANRVASVRIAIDFERLAFLGFASMQLLEAPIGEILDRPLADAWEQRSYDRTRACTDARFDRASSISASSSAGDFFVMPPAMRIQG